MSCVIAEDTLLSCHKVTCATILGETLVHLDCQQTQRPTIHTRVCLFQCLQLNIGLLCIVHASGTAACTPTSGT
jgi:hypothetical protein